MKNALWYSSLVVIGFTLMTMWWAPAWAATEVGDLNITFTQAVTLFALAAAWGDLRSKVTGTREDVVELRRRIENLEDK